jgi:ankyrin repeat protein
MTREPQTTERELEALLCAALDKDDGAGVLRILREGRTSVYMRMGQYETLMGRALGGKKLDVVAALLKAGASADTMCDLAAHAVEKGADDILAVVLAAGADPNRRDVYGWNLLGLAAWHGNVPAAEALLAAKADLSKTRETYGDPLASTGFSCDLLMAKALVQAKVDVDSPFTKECGMTALLFAAESVLDPAERDGGLDLVKYLLSAKADPTLADTCGRTAVSYASDAGNLAIVQTLLEAKASLDATRKDAEQVNLRAAGGQSRKRWSSCLLVCMAARIRHMDIVLCA